MSDPTASTFGEWLSDTGLANTKRIEHGEGWSLWTAQSYQDGTTATRSYLYLAPSCPWAEMERAASVTTRLSAHYTVVVPTRTAPQLEARSAERFKAVFPGGNLVTLQQMFYTAAINRNLRTTDLQHVENFVEQRISFPGSDASAPALKTIVTWLRGEIATNQKVAVLLAPGGQGKTTLARQIFNHFAEHRYATTIPVLVSNTSWDRQKDRITDMEDVWRYGIRECCPDAGVSPEMLQKSLFLGTFCSIFDGLDELCTILPWDFKPDEVLANLINTFEGVFGDGRLLITSRLTFWQEFIAPHLARKVLQIELHKFDAQERDAYLGMRFPENSVKDTQKRERAARILSRIASRTATYKQDPLTARPSREPYDRIESVPFVVMLAADSADTDASDVTAAYGETFTSTDPLRGLLLAICERETLRHKLPAEFTSEAQLNLLETLAAQFGNSILEEDVELTISDARIAQDTRAKLADHHLLARRGHEYVFTYSFVFDYLRASVLLKWLQGKTDNSAVTNILVDSAGQPGNLLDGAADLIQSVCGEDWISLGRQRFIDLFKSGTTPKDPRCQAGFFHIFSTLAKRESLRAVPESC